MYLDTARRGADQIDRDIDPHARLVRVAQALAEIRAKTAVTPAIDQALINAQHALDAIARRLNSWRLIIDGLSAEKALLRVRIDELAAALRSAAPDPVTAFLHGF
ncbi:hypothetical protein [Caulobacter sp.]|uniref:hypothetical protein n=1 Tax=Caulobacter sp. TaxID=78 RepID=UPI0031E26220